MHSEIVVVMGSFPNAYFSIYFYFFCSELETYFGMEFMYENSEIKTAKY